MQWIKRNLIFVITAAVGVALMGWAIYAWLGSRDEDKTVNDDFQSVLNEITAMRNKNPYPTPENIELAKAEAAQMKGLLGEFQKVFVPFPTPPAMDEKGFAAELTHRISGLQAAANTNGVKIPAQYWFTFSGLQGQLAFPSNCIPVWLEQLDQIQDICDILYRAHVNEIDSLQRVPVYPGDQGGADFVATTWVTNQLGVVSPYQVSFISHSGDLAQVLQGFLSSSNCFVVKSVVVVPTKAQANSGSPSPAYQPQYSAPAPSRPAPVAGDRYAGILGGGSPSPSPTPTPSATYAPRMAAATGPVTVIREKPLYITLIVDAIKLKKP